MSRISCAIGCVFFVFSLSSVAESVCGNAKASNGIAYEYCIFPSEDADNKDIMLHFHGLGGSARTWETAERHKAIRAEWEKLGHSVPTVMTISFDKVWLLTDVKKSGERLNLVVDEIYPKLKKMAKYDGAGRRLLLGESMGGFNALQLYLKYPGDFDKAAILCPAVADLAPNSSLAQLESYIKRTGAQRARVYYFMKVAKDNFPTPASWRRHNPLQLAKKTDETYPPIYLTSGDLDEYGFFEGYKLLSGILLDRNVPVMFKDIKNGGHCSLDPAEVAEFMSE